MISPFSVLYNCIPVYKFGLTYLNRHVIKGFLQAGIKEGKLHETMSKTWIRLDAKNQLGLQPITGDTFVAKLTKDTLTLTTH